MSWIYVVIVGALLALLFIGRPTVPEITWDSFKDEMLINGDAEKLSVIDNERVEVYIRKDRLGEERHRGAAKPLFGETPTEGPHYFFNIGSVEVFYQQLKDARSEIPSRQLPVVTYEKTRRWWSDVFLWVLPLVLIFLFWRWMLGRAAGGGAGGGSVFSFGQSKARVLEKGETSKVTFKDVAGSEEAKEEIAEIVKFLKAPDKYRRLGAKIPKGVLLVGPPGTGKTLLARAVAGEAGVPFFSLSGSEFIEMFVGVGAARMRDLFQKAKAKAPSIIFIDEIDTVGRARGRVSAFQANDERESTLNQLLAELDGFDTNTGVIVLAATNRGDLLDPALLRPGRFDRHIYLELPNLRERKAIFNVHLRPLKLAKDVDLEIIVSQTPGFSGAAIANVCNEAALIAARHDKDAVGMQDFHDAIDRVVGGLEKKSRVITPGEKERIAYHEAGHVVASWFLEHAHPVLKVSIIPRGRSLGAAWFLPEEHLVVTGAEFFDEICAAMGGRVAEELVFGEVSSNALDDLEKVTKQAYTMVANYGLGREPRNLSYYDSTGRTEQSLQRPYSEKTAEKIDTEVQRIVDEAYARTHKILESHRDTLDALAGMLMKKEVVYREEIETLLGPGNHKSIARRTTAKA